MVTTVKNMAQQQRDGIQHLIGELQKVIDGTRRTGWGDSEALEDNLRDIADRLVAMSQVDYPDTFSEFMKKYFEKGDLEGIANHGADGGYPFLTYNVDISRVYDKYEDEIWDALVEDSEDFGHDNVPEFMATFRRSDIMSDMDLRNRAVWYMAERTAREVLTNVTLMDGTTVSIEDEDVLFVSQAVHDQWVKLGNDEDATLASLDREPEYVRDEADKRGFFELADWIERHKDNGEALRSLQYGEYAVEDQA